MKTFARYFPKLKESFFLFGPRGTGKSTWLKMTYPEALIIDLLSSRSFLSYSSDPERLLDIVEGNPDKKTIIVDEIQRVPELLTIVHKILEEKKELKFILTGSSPRKLKKTGVDLLAGRAVLKRSHPFMASEIGDYFNLDSAIKYGLIPLVFVSENPDQVLNSYADLYLREEIQAEGIVRNIGNFSRFLEAISFSHASVLNISEVSRECMIERKTVEGYIKILEDLLISYRLPVFMKRAKRILVSHSKFYFFDSGIYDTIRPRGPLDNPSEISGLALEGLVLQHLKAWSEYSSSKYNLYYWRTKSGREVDFVVYGQDQFTAIEVKNSSSIHQKDIKNLLAFKEDYPEASVILLYRGGEVLRRQGVLCIPVEIFLKKLIPGRSLWE